MFHFGKKLGGLFLDSGSGREQISTAVRRKRSLKKKKKKAHLNSEILIKQKTSNVSHVIGAVDSCKSVLVKAT